MIHYSEFTPTPSLFPFVECIWTLRSHNNFFKKRELIIPGGRVEMIFNLSEPVNWIDSRDLSLTRSCAGSYLLGPRNRHFFVEQKGIIDMMGIRFRPGGLASFTSMPVSILMNELVAADQIFGAEADELISQLFETDNAQLNVACLERFLIKRLRADSDTRQTLQLISLVKNYELYPR